MHRSATAEWDVWSTTARVVVTDPAALPAARAQVEQVLADVELAASLFRPDSEVRRIAEAEHDQTVVVSEQLADLLRAALAAATVTAGAVDPTLGTERAGATASRRDRTLTVRRPLAERDLTLTGRLLRVPAGTLFDLGATAKAWAADRGADLVAARLDTGVLVSLGGDIRVAGPPPPAGWQVLVQDGPDQPATTVSLLAGAVATSSTLARRTDPADPFSHHILDPRTGNPCQPVWRTVTAVGDTCVEANTWSTAAVVWGEAALANLDARGATARLVDAAGHVHTTGRWPA